MVPKKIKCVAFVACLLLSSVSGCYYDSEQALYPGGSNITSCDTAAVTYTTTIVAILQASCSRCHAASVANSLGGNINLDNYSNVHLYSVNGKLLGSITHSSGFSAMPNDGSRLSNCDIAAFRKWIDSGAANN